MKVLATRGDADYGLTYWHDIEYVFRRDPMKPGKWFYQRDFSDTIHPVRMNDKLFSIEREWFKKYFKKNYIVKFTGEQQRAFTQLVRQNENGVEDYFKKKFRDAGITNYLFIMGISDNVLGGLGFLDENDAILGQIILDQMTDNEGDIQLS